MHEPGAPGDARGAYFTVSDERYFLGAIALVESLRRTGNKEPIVVLDAGLRADQRAVLADTCRIVPLPDMRSAANAAYYKLVAPSIAADDVDVVVLVDSDMLITASLAPVIRSAAAGRVVCYPDPESARWFADWESIFGLDHAPRKQTYVNSGFVAFSRSRHPELLRAWAEACRSIASHPTVAEGAIGPTAQADQDALNALLMGSYPADVVDLRPADEAPQANDLAAGVDIADARSLACLYRGTSTVLLHAAGNPKPWRSWRGMRRTAYSVLLVEVLGDLLTRVPADALRLPWWLRPGALVDSARLVLHVLIAGRNRARAGLRRVASRLGPSGAVRSRSQS
jgi:hypothetical protein